MPDFPSQISEVSGRRGGVGRGVDADVEAGFFEVAELLRHVDPGVVGVGVEVQRQAERLRRGARFLRLLAAGGESEGGGENREGEGEGRDSRQLHPLCSIAK